MTKTIDWDYIEERLLNEGYPESKTEEMLNKLKKIDTLRKQKNAIILAHYYQSLPIQLIADKCGDSLALAMAADDVKDKDLIISSTVHFMAEMVKLVNPNKKVIIPNKTASCSIAEGMNGATLRRLKEYYPTATLIGYINSTAEVKSELDVCCTSSNAVEVVQKVSGNPIIMLPDEYFALNIYKQIETDKEYLAYRGISNGNIVLVDPKNNKQIEIPLEDTQPPQLDRGICIVHEEFTKDHVDFYRQKEKVDLVLAHPEVKPEVAEKADMVGGTGKMIKYVGTTDAKKILYLTECDLAAPLIEAHSDRKFITPCVLCPYMKKNSVDLILHALETECDEVTVDAAIAPRARASIIKMFELTEVAQKLTEAA